ncbi:MAG: hypothetical protein U1F52_09980 [Burkholderiales bacterium]
MSWLKFSIASFVVLALTGCGGGGSTSTPGTGAAVSGISTPSTVSVVTAN